MIKHLTALTLFILLVPLALADYHYASHTGSNEYPYTSWATAADSIQKAIDAADPFDTVFIGSGQYEELIRMARIDSCISIIGMGWDSTTILTHANAYLFLYGHKTSFKDIAFRHYGISGASILGGLDIDYPRDLIVRHCKFWGSEHVCGILAEIASIEIIENCIFDSLDVYDKTAVAGPLGLFRNNLCMPIGSDVSLFVEGHKIIVENNIFDNKYFFLASAAILQAGSVDTFIVLNNLVNRYYSIADAGNPKIGSYIAFNVSDSSSRNTYRDGNITIFSETADSAAHLDIYGNSFRWDTIAIQIYSVTRPSFVDIDYNDFGGSITPISYTHPGLFDSTGNISARDAMFVGNGDYHLQAFSPLIDAGPPDILDVDGSRSDIGIYGGPLGQAYTYQDLPPHKPDSLRARANPDSGYIDIFWEQNYEADFREYLIYRDTLANFEPSSNNLIARSSSSGFRDSDYPQVRHLYYRIEAMDNQGNSSLSDELQINFSDIYDYGDNLPAALEITGNYPNPFNSQTVIEYTVANLGPLPAKITINIYDILGRVIRVIDLEKDCPGQHSIVWDGRDNEGNELTSGVYFAKISQWGYALGAKPRKITLLR
jgi:hypothetical protein